MKQPQEKDRKWLYVLLGVGIIIIVAISYFLFFKPSKPPEAVAVCGNNICEIGENCYDCPADCKCNPGEYCSKEEKKCLKSICGDGICDPLEDWTTCCDDCGCVGEGEVCNKETHACEIPMTLTDQRAEELARKYFEDKGMEVVSVEVTYTGLMEDKTPAKFLTVFIAGQEWPESIAVTENEEVIEIQTYH